MIKVVFHLDVDEEAVGLEALVKGCEITKAGVLELINRQADGCAYVKP
ncbi:conserved hypothetical protein [delta proteobacterium NaphS2]|nr:conserved hypothetical protein [delta proteobacterium NaphS2]